jgi:aldehyde:ferredoxin oxidoreductase
MGLAHITSSRGADHLKAFPTIDETGYTKEVERRYGKEYLPEMADPHATRYKPFLVKDGEDFGAVVDSVGVCKSGGTFVMAEIYWPEIAEGLTYVTGIEFSVSGLKAVGERIYNLMRAYNALHGITRADDRLPRRFTEEPPSIRMRRLLTHAISLSCPGSSTRTCIPTASLPTVSLLTILHVSSTSSWRIFGGHTWRTAWIIR